MHLSLKNTNIICCLCVCMLHVCLLFSLPSGKWFVIYLWFILTLFFIYHMLKFAKGLKSYFQDLSFLGLTHFFLCTSICHLPYFKYYCGEVTFQYMFWVAFRRQIIHNWTVFPFKDSFNIQRARTRIWFVLEKNQQESNWILFRWWQVLSTIWMLK